MNVLEKLVRNEVVAHQPKEVGEEDQEGERDSTPEPTTGEEAPGTLEHHAA
jgi:hypothetical protein